MARKIYWLSESIGPTQQQAVMEVHGEDIEIVQDLTVFARAEEFADYLRATDGFVYALVHAGPLEVLLSAGKETGITFGIMSG